MSPRTLGQHRVGRQPHAVEHQLAGDRGAQRHLVLDLGGGEARGVGRDDEAADRRRRCCAHTTATSATEPLVIHILRAVEHPVVAVAPGAGAHRAGVGAGVGLGQPEAADRLAGGHPRQPLLLLLLAARSARSRTSPATPAPRPATGCPSRRPRAPGRPGRTSTALMPGAAVALEVHAEQAELAEALHQAARVVDLAALEPVRDVRRRPPGRRAGGPTRGCPSRRRSAGRRSRPGRRRRTAAAVRGLGVAHGVAPADAAAIGDLRVSVCSPRAGGGEGGRRDFATR